MTMNAPHSLRGFTLIELIVTVAIVGLLATMAVPMAEMAYKHEKEHELRLTLREIRTALDAYKQAVDEGRIAHSVLDQSGYPPSLKTLVDGVPDVKSPNGKAKLYFLRRIPRDPMSTDTTMTNEDTWGKRSYASSADSPEEGSDLYDVYSLSEDVGINGVPYREW